LHALIEGWLVTEDELAAGPLETGHVGLHGGRVLPDLEEDLLVAYGDRIGRRIASTEDGVERYGLLVAGAGALLQRGGADQARAGQRRRPQAGTENPRLADATGLAR
jgi:hypothetical protein